ncbi:MAG TPA: selenium metabolism-associated LysR family transcriptional regulator [Methylomirabilota bacterium]|jgi:DNA-binding transcriptional LysR family regulator|nr:selenium metabolism-associated LysR family transcriptional regulator [Methylomirabilota bacterium]
MDLRRLEIFVKVAEIGSFSRAAEALFLTQPTVSEHVRALEDELGVQLLDRLGRGTTPTRAGTLLLGYARRLLALSREATQAIEHFQGRVSGELTVGGSSIPGEYVMPELIGSFRSKHPDVRITLLIGSSREVQGWVEEGRVEIGVVGAPPSARTLEAQPLMADELVLVVGAEHPWATRTSVTLEDLRSEPLILRERGSGSRATFEQALAGRGMDLASFRVVGEIASTQAVKQAVRAGVGVSMISRRAVEDECRARLLACVKIQDLTVTRAFHLLTHRERSRSPLAQAFLVFVESQVVARPS